MSRPRGRRRDTPQHVSALYRSGALGNEGRACGKTAFPNLKIANARARALGHKPAYKCPICKKCHIGGPNA